MIDIQSQDRAEQIADVLAGQQRIRDAAAVARDEVQHSVQPEPNAAAVVPARRPFEDQLLARSVGRERLACDSQPSQSAPFLRRIGRIRNARDKQETVLLELRMRRDAVDRSLQIDDQLRLRVFARRINRPDLSRPLGYQ